MAAVAETGKRLNLNLSDRAYDELSTIAREGRRSMTEVVRLGIGLVRLALEAQRKGQTLAVVTREGQAIREIVLPE